MSRSTEILKSCLLHQVVTKPNDKIQSGSVPENEGLDIDNSNEVLGKHIQNLIFRDDAEGVIKALLDYRKNLYKSFVESALRMKSLNTLRHLKKYESELLWTFEVRKFHIKLFQGPSEFNRRWILRAFEKDFCFIAGNVLTPKIALQFIQYKAYGELLTIFQSQFDVLDKDCRLFICKSLFDAIHASKWSFWVLPSGMKAYVHFFELFFTVNRTNSCIVLRDLSIPCVASNFAFWKSSREKWYYIILISHCRQCKGAHIWDAIEYAIKTNNKIFFRQILNFDWTPLSMPFSVFYLSRIVSRSTSPQFFMRNLLKLFKAKFTLNHWFGFKLYSMILSAGNLKKWIESRGE